MPGTSSSTLNVFANDHENRMTVPYSGLHEHDTKLLIRNNWFPIRTYAKRRRFTKIYNVCINDSNITEAIRGENVLNMFIEQNTKFKIIASFRSILLNNIDEILRYYHSSSNKDNCLAPWVIESRVDLETFIDAICNKDFIEQAIRSRPDTSWTMHMLTNLTFYLYPILNHPIAYCPSLPIHIRNNPAITIAELDCNGKPFNDKFCFFRALVLMEGIKKCTRRKL
ncbi:hypothetical protein EB796_021958 [Bugula neritina]|uniref:Uncharacterized protein n=1 Tax=Bugula neritina TaxID=10212 RepID=A0A7J7J0M6_BUGNE|nr:hypothetical protein EB796_021958 [Bugula neritina]